MELSDKRNGFNVKVMCDDKIAHEETRCIYSKELGFVAVFANGLNVPKKGNISVMNGGEILLSGFKHSAVINTAPDMDMCTSVVIYYNNDNLSDIINLISTGGNNTSYHKRLNTINKSLTSIVEILPKKRTLKLIQIYLLFLTSVFIINYAINLFY